MMTLIQRYLFLIISFLFMGLTSSYAQSSQAEEHDAIPIRKYFTKATAKAPTIDGTLTDEVWSQVEWSGDFTQREPIDAGDPTSETEIKILYDNKHIYIAVRCFDPDPDKIVRRMSRRDGFEGDWVEVNIDSYYDKRSAFSFTASVSGVKSDEYVTQDGGNWDTNWNPIWNFKTNVDELGWTAEYEIPLSQLRFDNKDEQVWGLQFTRRDFRNESKSNWQYNPNNSGYWVSAFGELHGIKGIKPKRQIEIQPYLLGQHTTKKAIPNHPYQDGSESKFSAGVDGKIGVTNDLTLDFTVNPDFGQVEADPAALNLDGFEIFFTERRPFFVENRNLFNYNISNSNAGGAYDSDNLFYSRRIGAVPHIQYAESPRDSLYIDAPDFSSILGAAKFSGKTNKGLSIGILESVTQKEKVTINSRGKETQEVVEPFTNYGLLRLQQDINQGNTVIGLIGTTLNRDLETALAPFLHKSAYSGGIDLLHQWKNKKWRLNASYVASRVEGSREAIRNTQRSFVHGFQRPDADHLSVDENATSLSGTGANVSIGNYGNRLQYQIGATYRSPGLELNDIGFLRNADEVNQYLWVGYRWNQPFSIFRNFRANFNEWARWDFGGRLLYNAFNVNVQGTFTNFYSATIALNFETNDISNTWLRQGPAFRKPQGFGGSFSVSSDSRKKVQLSYSMNGGRGYDNSTNSMTYSPSIEWQLSDAFNTSLGASWSRDHREDQYVTTRDSDFGKRYVVSDILRKTLSFTLRLNYNITPDLTLQYYGQPYISRGLYNDFKYVNDPLAQNVDVRLKSFNQDQIEFQDRSIYFIDENRDGSADYSFRNPNFDFVQFRSNLVARWEYKPGSEIFLVWSQGSTAFASDPTNDFGASFTENLWDDSLFNTFLIKLTYRLTN